MFLLFPRVIKPEVCDGIVKDCLTKDLDTAKVLDFDLKSSRDDPNVRKASVYSLPTERGNKANELVWHFFKEANKQMFNYDLTYFETLSFIEYKDGGFYDWHIDSYLQDKPNKTRKLSLSLMLTDPNTFEGGELQFYTGAKPMDDQIKFDLQSQGSIVVFDSRDWHRVTPCTNGTRYSMVSWATGASFK